MLVDELRQVWREVQRLDREYFAQHEEQLEQEKIGEDTEAVVFAEQFIAALPRNLRSTIKSGKNASLLILWFFTGTKEARAIPRIREYCHKEGLYTHIVNTDKPDRHPQKWFLEVSGWAE